MQQFIFPAADAALELQEAVNAYLKKFDNPLIKTGANRQHELDSRTRKIARAKVLYSRIQHIKFCLGVLARRTPDTVENQGRHEVLTKMWDWVEKFRGVNDAELRTLTDEVLDAYIADMTKAVEVATKHIRVPNATLRRLGMMPPAEDESILSLKDCLRIVHAVIQDEVDMSMRWRPVNSNDISNQEMVLTSLFPDWDGLDDSSVRHLPVEHVAVWREQCEQCSAHFYREIIEPTILKIAQWVHTTIPYRTWDVWSVCWLAQDLVLEPGRDFRIMDWERRMQSGEWNPEILPTEQQEIAKQSTADVEATLKRFEQEAAAGFSPRTFYTRLTERPITQPFKAAAKEKKSRA